MEIRHLAAIVAAVCWVGWTQRTHIKSAVVAAWQRVAPMAKSAKASWLIPLAIGGGLLWPDIAKYLPKPSLVVPIVVRNDPLSKAQTAQRSAEVAMLRELAADTSPNTQAKLDKVVGLRDAIRLQTQAVYTDAIAEAVFAGTLNELADDLEGVK
jgi:hypothetical protein